MRDGQTIMNKKRSLHNLNQGLLCKIRSTTQKWLLKRIGKNSINHQTKVIEKGTSIITETQARKTFPQNAKFLYSTWLLLCASENQVEPPLNNSNSWCFLSLDNPFMPRDFARAFNSGSFIALKLSSTGCFCSASL